MTTEYEVWLNARHPKTLESVATIRVYHNTDRLIAERVLETAAETYSPIANLLRIFQPGAVVSAEMVLPRAPAGVFTNESDTANAVGILLVALDKIEAIGDREADTTAADCAEIARVAIERSGWKRT